MKKNIRLVVPVLGVMFLLLLSACGNTDSKVKKNSEEGKTLKIVTNFLPNV